MFDADPGTATNQSKQPKRPAGRRRDQGVHERILQAGLEVFCTAGWSGFTLEAVARAADVGKSSMYLRFKTREELVLEVVRRYNFRIDEVHSNKNATVNEELHAFATSYANWLDRPEGRLVLRGLMESNLNTTLPDDLREYGRDVEVKTHAIIRRAKRRGEIPKSASAAVILDSLFGALVHHTATASERPTYASAKGQAFVHQLVEHILAGAMNAG